MSIFSKNDVKISPQGYQINDAPENSNPFWSEQPGQGTTDYVKSLSIVSESDTKGGTNYTLKATDGEGNVSDVGVINVPADNVGITDIKIEDRIDPDSAIHYWLVYTKDGKNYDVGEIPNGRGVSKAVVSVSLTNENGVYTLKYTDSDGQETEVGTIEVPSVDTSNILAEVNDSIVEDDTNGFDYHTIKETEYNGTQNDVGSFYLARKQITAIEKTDSGLDVKTVNQSGETETKAIKIDGGVTLHNYEYTKNQLNIVRSSGKISNYGRTDNWFIPGIITIFISGKSYSFVGAFGKGQYNTISAATSYFTQVEEADGKQIIYFIKMSTDAFSANANYTQMTVTIYSNSESRPNIIYGNLYFTTVPDSTT